MRSCHKDTLYDCTVAGSIKMSLGAAGGGMLVFDMPVDKKVVSVCPI